MSIPLSKEFIKNYMTTAPPIYVIAYISLLSQDKWPDNKTLAYNLRLTESEWEAALYFWREQKILSITSREITFSLENKTIYKETNLFAYKETDETENNIQAESPGKLEEQKEQENKKVMRKVSFKPSFQEKIKEHDNSLSGKYFPPTELPVAKEEDIFANLPEIILRGVETKPTYSPKEIERFMENSFDIQILFATAERLFGKPLSTTEMNTLLTFYEYYTLPVEVIEEMLAYSIRKGNKGWRYIEKVALDWADSGINTIEKAKQRIAAFNTDYRQLMEGLGLGNEYPTKKQQSFFDKWLSTPLPMELLLEACERTVILTGKASFAYADTIIKDWVNLQITDLEDLEKADEAFKNNREQEAKRPGNRITTTKAKNVANFKQRDWDFDQLDKLDKQQMQDRLVN